MVLTHTPGIKLDGIDYEKKSGLLYLARGIGQQKSIIHIQRLLNASS